MLVKVGSAWIDPNKVTGISDYTGKASIRTTDGTFECGSIENIDEYAAIINGAGQSYGAVEEIK